MRLLPMLVVSLVFLAGCATGPRYDTAAAAMDLTPAEVSTNPEIHLNTRVVWGGVIVATRNQARHTELEVLAYPLDGSQKPRLGQTPQGRFLIHQPGYLEEVDYAPGRQVTVTGALGQRVEGRVGEAPYTYPLVQGEALHLWPAERYESGGRPRFNIGVGVIFGG